MINNSVHFGYRDKYRNIDISISVRILTQQRCASGPGTPVGVG
jgi:hypothetical protein